MNNPNKETVSANIINRSMSTGHTLSLNKYEPSPSLFSQTTPRGQAALTTCRIAGVNRRGGETTRSAVEDTKESPNASDRSLFCFSLAGVNARPKASVNLSS